jgi:hypothetical protein
MAKRLRHRFEEMERRLSKLKLRIRPTLRREACYHAMAVAGIVSSGQPRIDEPLQHAWARTLRHHGITVKDQGSWDGQVVAARRLFDSIMAGAEESVQFTQLFKTAPVWLLRFTGTAMDARLLKFELPDNSRRFIWGSAGYEDARRWPLLPLGRMADGEPIPPADARRLWIALFCDPIGEFPDNMDNFAEEERITDPLINDMIYALGLDGVPEEELFPHQKRRLRRLSERISRL